MKSVFSVLIVIINIIALLIFASGLVMTILGGYDFLMVFSHFSTDQHETAGLMAVDLLNAVDIFLVAIVFFVLSIGIMILFNNPDATLPVKLPEWLRIKNFLHLKIILWEAILTTLVVSYLAALAEKKINGVEITWQHLIVPVAVLLISLSLFLVRRGEK
ncbi:MAG: YqhA family protein [Terrimonas sp.]|nr:YqhA family protein [Terrimonas sp.]OJY95647.1 MAG: hypothetical protein BGP13_12490 [Sphingobacteriales bacterium 40-81]